MKLYLQIIVALFVGVIVGIFLPEINQYTSWAGVVFIRALKMIIIPLIVSSLISGVVNIGSAENLGRLGIKTMTYYVTTSVFAILTGLFFVNLLKPGVGGKQLLSEKVDTILAHKPLAQTLIEIIPENIFNAFVENKMLSIIFFSILFGFFIAKVSKKHRRNLERTFNSIFEVMMKITSFVIKFTPYGVFAIVVKVVSTQKDFSALVSTMGLYMLTVLLALSLHSIVTLPLLSKFVGKINPIKHFRAMRIPLLTAFSTSSSGATLPLTMEEAEHKAGISNKISSFTLPLGATINMDGTALYECVAAIFIAQVYGIDLSFNQQAIVVFTALLASIGAAGIPMAGLVMITVVLSAIGLPLEGVGLILSVDRILDMFRTAVNVWSDSCGVAIIAKSEKEKLKV